VPTTIIDIIDTAVKIGLGATISGIATYSVTKYKQNKDAELAKTERKQKSLDLVAEQVEEFSHLALNYWARILDWTRRKNSNVIISETKEKELKTVKTDLFNSYKLLASAESKLLLMKEEEAQKLLRKYGEEFSEFFALVYVGDHGISVEEIQNWRLKILDLRKELFAELSTIYQKL
jgi:hypothetical protein